MKAFSVRELAERWSCSERTVRSLIAERRLPSFRLGVKLIRISAKGVEEYERAEGNNPVTGYASSASSLIAASGPPSTKTPPLESIISTPSGRTIRVKWSKSAIALAKSWKEKRQR
jgi:excisionase family DNA binding protein